MLGSALTSQQFFTAIYETFYMLFISLSLGSLLGIPLGLLLVMTREKGILENRKFYVILNGVINIFRSIPFIILLASLTGFTRFLVHTAIGTTASTVPLTIYIAPYIARLIEGSLLEVNDGILEAANAMGASPLQVIRYFLIPEAKGSLILSLTTATIGLIGATAMAGAVGGGGIGDLAITFGYNRYDGYVSLICVITLLVIVQTIQSLGTYFSKKIRK